MVRERSTTGSSARGRGYEALREEEQRQLFSDLKALRADRLRQFLVDQELDHRGTKVELATRAIAALENDDVKLAAVVAYLDQAAAWGKQHVLLFDAPPSGADLDPRKWRDETWLHAHLKSHGLASLLGARKPLVLPPKMQLVAIELDHEAKLFRVEAVQRRQGTERDEDLDEQRETPDGETVQLRAFREIITRGLVVFEWDLRNNVAMLQIRQLPAGTTYEEAYDEFAKLVTKWLPIRLFPSRRLARSIPALRAQAKDPKNGIRAHGVDLVGLDGRRLIGRSQRAKQQLHGNTIIDGALDDMTQASGLGYSGNFFFIIANNDNDAAADEGGEIEQDDAGGGSSDVHVLIYADKKNHINFTTPQTEKVIRDVLQRIRATC